MQSYFSHIVDPSPDLTLRHQGLKLFVLHVNLDLEENNKNS